MSEYISRLSLRGKFLLISIAMLIPIGMLAVSVGRLELERLGHARLENQGRVWAVELATVAANLAEYREHAAAVGAGAADERSEMVEHAANVRGAAGRLDSLLASSAQLAQASNWSALRPRVQ